jgi:hypothetical protein
VPTESQWIQQCCGSGDFFDPLDPGWVNKKQDPDSGIKHPGSYIRELGNNFWVKIHYLNSLMRIRDSGNFLTRDPGWKKFGSGINIQDPQHWDPDIFIRIRNPEPVSGTFP